MCAGNLVRTVLILFDQVHIVTGPPALSQGKGALPVLPAMARVGGPERKPLEARVGVENDRKTKGPLPNQVISKW